MSDAIIRELMAGGRLKIDASAGLVYAPKSNTPNRSISAVIKKGYLRACLNIAGKQVHFMVHRIVWVALHGPIPDGYQIDHRDGDKQNNSIANLEAVPPAVNMQRAKEAGLYAGNGRRDGVRDASGRFGKKRAGRLLDGVLHDAYPQPGRGA